ncbi:MAG: IS66 family transposase [Actinomycetota bacterium]
MAKGRGFAWAAPVLGGGFAGVIVRDGRASYRKFALATHRSCLAHLLRRCHEMIEAGGERHEVPNQARGC